MRALNFIFVCEHQKILLFSQTHAEFLQHSSVAVGEFHQKALQPQNMQSLEHGETG